LQSVWLWWPEFSRSITVLLQLFHISLILRQMMMMTQKSLMNDF
jgi:hypothetical protein